MNTRVLRRSIPLVVAMCVSATAVHAQERIVCVVDAATNTPVPYARVRVGEREVATSRRDARDSVGAGCVVVPASARGAIQVTRIGYAPLTLPIDGQNDVTATARGDAAFTSRETLYVRLVPLAAVLPANVTVAPTSASAGPGVRNAVTLSVDSSRALGASTTGALVALLPYTFPRSARGEVSLSLRGARREQVAVTLDGLPLTDPATGLADLADVPLVALSSVTVSPGSDPLGAGPGAAGGVLSLQSGDGSIASLRLGAFGDVATEAAWSHVRGDVRLRIGGAYRTAQNDFPFVNTASTSGTALRETRVNNDVTRANALVQLQAPRAHVTLLVSRAELGLVGPVNVRAYDDDRSTTTRVFVRGTAQAGLTLLSASARAFALDYRDPARPQFNSDAQASVVDVDARRTVGGVLLHVGAGGDRLRTSTDVSQERARGFLSAVQARRAYGLEWTGGARVDAIGGGGVLPSFSLAAVRRHERIEAGVRVAQAVRVPTLYDLYFSSPQRLTVRALQSERVIFDGEVHARWRTSHSERVRLSIDGALVQRVTRNAIIWFPGNFGWSPANVGTESLRGVEARATLSHGPIDVSVWGTAYDPELTSGSLRIPTPYVPAVAGGSVTRAQLGVVQFAASSRWLGPRPFTAGPRDPAFTLPTVFLLDLTTSTRRTMRGRDLLLAASLDNATNRAWQSVRGFPAPGRSWSVAITIRP